MTSAETRPVALEFRPHSITWAAVVLVCIQGHACATWGAAPTLKFVFPAGAARGSEVVTTCSGEFSWPVKVWAPGVTVAVLEESGKLQVTVPADLPVDRVWIRLFDDEGSSAAVPFLIGSLPEIQEEEPNNSRGDAQAIQHPSVTINGVLHKNGEVDAYTVELESGQTLVADVDANRRLGSPMDAVLQVVAPDGSVLAENHDNVGLDPRLAYTANVSGAHIVRLFAFPAEPDTTIAFRGGANYIYRLTLTTGPFISHGVPLAISCGGPGDVRLVGWNLAPGSRLPVVSYGGPSMSRFQEFESEGDTTLLKATQLGFVFAPELAGSARIRIVSESVTVGDRTDAGDAVCPLVVPAAMTGCLHAPNQVDAYRLPLTKGQQVVIAVESQRLGLPTVPGVRLLDPTGELAAEVAEGLPRQDVVIRHTASQDGDYSLLIRDRFGHGGPRYFYRLMVDWEQVGFDLSLESDAVIVTSDQAADLPVTVVRRAGPEGAVGPITIEAVDLPEGIDAPAVVSESEGPTAEKVTVRLSTSGKAFAGSIRIRGTAHEPIERVGYARTPPTLGASFEAIWLTAVALPAAEPDSEAASSPGP